MRLVLLLLAVLLGACAGPRDRIVLLPSEDPGGLTLHTAQGTQALTAPATLAAVQASGQVRARAITEAETIVRWGPVLATMPQPARVYPLSFDAGKATLRPEDSPVVEALLADVAACAACEVLITGHTDTVGERAANDALSLARAETVRVLLVQAGLRTTFLRVVGRGERQLLVPTADEVAEERNRRVEVLVR